MSNLSLRAKIETWPLANSFAISRGVKDEAVVVTVEISDGTHTGRGEGTPYGRYGETPELVQETIEAMGDLIATGTHRHDLQKLMPVGAARNALDCALWDLEAKQKGKSVFDLAGWPELKAVTTAFTISLDTPEKMAEAANKATGWSLLKIKLGGPEDAARLKAIRKAAPKAELIVDANEGWTQENLIANLTACKEAGVTLVEQPLPSDQDSALDFAPHPVPICADESLHDRSQLGTLKGKYEAVNIKLDKAGGLTEALLLTEEAMRLGFDTMAGCMVSTSLAIAPALLFAQKAKWVDLDGPLWLAKDRTPGLRYEKERLFPAPKELWG